MLYIGLIAYAVGRGDSTVEQRRVVGCLGAQLRRPVRRRRWRGLLLGRGDCIVAVGRPRARIWCVDLFEVQGRNARLDALGFDFGHCAVAGGGSALGRTRLLGGKETLRGRGIVASVETVKRPFLDRAQDSRSGQG